MATLTQRGKSWLLSWIENGRQERRSLGPIAAIPRKQAEAILHAKQLEFSQAAHLLPNLHRSAAPTFTEWAKEYALWHECEFPDSHWRVKQIIEQYLLPEFGGSFMDAIDPLSVERFKKKRRKVAADATVVKEFRTLVAIINRAIETKVIRENPISTVKAPRILDSKPHRFYEADELVSIYAATRTIVNGGEGTQTNPEHGAWWRLFVNTGMRRAEGLNLERRWIGGDGLRVVSTEAARTKSAKWRDIPLAIGAAEALKEIPKRGVYVLPRMAATSLSRAFDHALTRANLDGSLHTLRHTYISHLVRAGVPLRTVQLYAGHSSVTVTEKYAYLMPGRAAEAAVALAL